MISPAKNLAVIQNTLEKLASELGIPVPKVMAVTKDQPVDNILPLLEAGHRFFGENRVQEAWKKWPALKQQYPDIVLHLIGSLQTNKAKEAVKLFDCIETLDRPSLAIALNKAFEKTGLKRDLLLQVNTSLETQKHGVLPNDLSNFYSFCQKIDLPIKGFMCVPAIHKDPSQEFEFLQKAAKQYDLPFLSMGMSQDFMIAAAYGATWVRIGTRLFEAQ